MIHSHFQDPRAPRTPAAGEVRLGGSPRGWLRIRWRSLEMAVHADDRELLRAVQRGDPAAVERFVERLACIPAMLRIRERRLGTALSADERQEVVQETVSALWAKLPRYTGHRPLEAWVWGFVLREHYKLVCRAGRPRGGLVDELVPASASGPDPDVLAGVRAAVEELGPPDADIVRMRYLDALAFEDIGGELGVPTNTVKTRYYRAIERLRVKLRPLWKEIVG